MSDRPQAAESSSVDAAMDAIRAARGHARQFWRIFHKSVVPMAVVDNERRYVAVNAPAMLFYRLGNSELVGRRLDEFTPRREVEAMRQRWTRLMQRGSIAGARHWAFPDGGELTVAFSSLANALPGRHLIVFGPAGWPASELRAFPDAAEAPLPGPLSAREREVLALVASGCDQRQIADELTISVTTVRTHVRNALRKLGARNRPHAIALAIQSGIVDPLPVPDASSL